MAWWCFLDLVVSRTALRPLKYASFSGVGRARLPAQSHVTRANRSNCHSRSLPKTVRVSEHREPDSDVASWEAGAGVVRPDDYALSTVNGQRDEPGHNSLLRPGSDHEPSGGSSCMWLLEAFSQDYFTAEAFHQASSDHHRLGCNGLRWSPIAHVLPKTS